MTGWQAYIWRSKGLAISTSLVVSLALASVLYAFNWHTFYDTQRNLAVAGADRLAADVRDLVVEAPAGYGPERVQRHIDRRAARIDVTLSSAATRTTPAPPAANPLWHVDNAGQVDPRRSRLSEHFEWHLEGGLELVVEVTQGIRPPLGLALVRAWTFSAADYQRDRDAWWAEHLYNRSLPLYGYLLTVMVVGFGTVRALHRDQIELDQTYAEAHEVGAELSELRDLNRRETATLRNQVTETQAQRDAALHERERLDAEIAAVQSEYDAAAMGEAPERVDDDRLRAIKSKKSNMERALSEHDAVVAHVEADLSRSRDELEAAEELLSEVETRHADLESKLRDRNREIRRLQLLVKTARRDAREMTVETSQQLSRASAGAAIGSARYASLERQLESWIEPHDGVRLHFSDHSRTGSVEAFFEKLDRSFVDRFFTHATNPEYERGARRILRVHTTPADGDEAPDHGEIIVVLDDDAGRTLGLRYALRHGAPDADLVGFVLALLLRAGTRDLASYPIRIR